MVPMYVGLSIIAIGVCFGVNGGYALNPARDLAPRFLTLISGWGTQVFSYKNYSWFWQPIIGPHIGAIFGVIIYMLFIEIHWPNEADEVLATDVLVTTPEQRKEQYSSQVDIKE